MGFPLSFREPEARGPSVSNQGKNWGVRSNLSVELPSRMPKGSPTCIERPCPGTRVSVSQRVSNTPSLPTTVTFQFRRSPLGVSERKPLTTLRLDVGQSVSRLASPSREKVSEGPRWPVHGRHRTAVASLPTCPGGTESPWFWFDSLPLLGCLLPLSSSREDSPLLPRSPPPPEPSAGSKEPGHGSWPHPFHL